jgi:hypothetical protein
MRHMYDAQAETSVEVHSPSPCTCAAFAPSHSHMLGRYADGSIRLVATAPKVEVVWGMARHASPVVAVLPHPKKPWAISAAR